MAVVRKRRRVLSLRVSVAALVALLALGSSVGSPPPAAAFDENVTHWNIYGTCAGSGECGSSEAVDTIGYLVTIANPRPIMITVNEMCANDNRPGWATPMYRLTALLGPLGYTPRFAASDFSAKCEANSPCCHREFGNAVFAVGSVSSTAAIDTYLPHQASPT
jgi:hypothetical protein